MGRRHSFCARYLECLIEYCNNTFIHGCQHSVEVGRSKEERISWMFLVTGMIVATVWLLTSSYMSFLLAPTATSRSVYRVPINTIPFPAVAICSGTRISRQALKNYTEFIFFMQNSTTTKIAKTFDGVYDSLLQLGSFYTLNDDQDDFYFFDKLHSFFMELYGNPYPLQEIIANLTPPCEDFLKTCFWNGEEEDCSDLFQTNQTDYGPCCTFNHKRLQSSEMEALTEMGIDVPLPDPLFAKDSEFKEGLTVVIEQNSSDQIYNIQSSMATRILIFNPQDYPDISSNAYTERQVYLSGELFIELFPESIKGSETMRHVSAKARGCVFRDELMLNYRGFYTFSECYLTCKLKDMIRFCGCFPHQYSDFFNASHCLLNDMSCLIKWKNKWDNSESYISDVESQQTQYVVHQCPHCMPTCTYIKYGIRSNFGMLTSMSPENSLPQDSELVNGSHLSVVHVYFALPYAVEYQQTTVSTWYDLLASLGGLAGFTIGASLLSIMELLWFISGKFGFIWTNNKEIITKIYLSDFKIIQNNPKLKNFKTTKV